MTTTSPPPIAPPAGLPPLIECRQTRRPARTEGEQEAALSRLLAAVEETLSVLPAGHPLRAGLLILRRGLLLWLGRPALSTVPRR